jgi:putative membrane protein
MAKPFLTPDSKKALADAVRAVEAGCSAELVVAVRPWTGSYLHAGLLAGGLAAVVTLAVLLWSHWTFALPWFVIDPLLVGALVGFAVSRTTILRRALTSARERRARVETAARATFVERRIHGTSGRTGILLYVSVLEREAAFVVDLGVEALAATDGWKEATRGIERAVRDGADGTAVAERLRGLGGLLGPALVRSAADVDELPNEVC